MVLLYGPVCISVLPHRTDQREQLRLLASQTVFYITRHDLAVGRQDYHAAALRNGLAEHLIELLLGNRNVGCGKAFAGGRKKQPPRCYHAFPVLKIIGNAMVLKRIL